MAFGTDMKIQNGSVVMDAGVPRSMYFLHHVYTVSVCLVIEKDSFYIHQNCMTQTNFNSAFFTSQWLDREKLFVILQNL
jgi:hypothetical protein